MIRLLLTAMIACQVANAFAWNALGHKVVAEIAWRQLETANRQAIVNILCRHPRFEGDFAQRMPPEVLSGEKVVQDRWIFQHAATWPDIARGIPGPDHDKYDQPTWHYINYPLFLTASEGATLARNLPANLATEYRGHGDKSTWNVLQAIEYCDAVLAHKNAGQEAKALAYCWLFHLVGDIHQPMHSTALFSVNRFPEGDRGGNEIPLRQGANLHALWDNLLGERHYLPDVDRAVAELSDRILVGEIWTTAAKETRPGAWADESHELAAFAYHPNIRAAVQRATPQQPLERIDLPEEYLEQAGHRARERIVAAGIRLAVALGADQIKPPAIEVSATARKAPFGVLVGPLVDSAPPRKPVASQGTHWLNTKTNARHNSSCRWFGTTTHGRYCSATEGMACGICGG